MCRHIYAQRNCKPSAVKESQNRPKCQTKNLHAKWTKKSQKMPTSLIQNLQAKVLSKSQILVICSIPWKEAQQPLLTFRPMSTVAKRLDGSIYYLHGTEVVGLGPG